MIRFKKLLTSYLISYKLEPWYESQKRINICFILNFEIVHDSGHFWKGVRYHKNSFVLFLLGFALLILDLSSEGATRGVL